MQGTENNLTRCGARTVAGAAITAALSHDLGGPLSVAFASERALSLATIETPFFGLSFPG